MKDDKNNFHHHNHQNQLNGTYHPPQKTAQPKQEKDKSNGWSKVRKTPDADDHQFDMDI
jgi:hypothetical protein